MRRRCRTRVKVKLLLFCGALLVATTSDAAGKVVTPRLTVEGPAMKSPSIIVERHPLYRVASVLLFTGEEDRAGRPESLGARYMLTYRFGVSDGDGSRTTSITQALYPFASGGPVVFTAGRQGIDTTYGRVRFVHGWFSVTSGALRMLQRAGLPARSPELSATDELATERLPSSRSDGTPLAWTWVLGVGALVAAVTALQRRNRLRRASDYRC